MPKPGTLAIDSGSELARLVFSWEMKKHSGDFETIRAMQNYPGQTERLNMIARRCKDIVAAGIELVLICHEGIDKIYAKGGAMATRGGQAPEAAAIKGRIDIPGQAAPEEIMRAADNVFRVRIVNGRPAWITGPEPIPGSDGAVWQVKDRFNAAALGAYLPASYAELAKAAKAKSLNFRPPYFWILYGGVGFQKTRSLLTFPRPLKILDVDRGTAVISAELGPDDTIHQFNSEECDDYPRFMCELEATFDDPSALARIKSKLGVK